MALEKDANGQKLIHGNADVKKVYGNNRLYFRNCLRLSSPDFAPNTE